MQMKLRRWVEAGLPKDRIESELASYDRFRLRHMPGFAAFSALAEPVQPSTTPGDEEQP